MKLRMLFSSPEEMVAQINTLTTSPRRMQQLLELLADPKADNDALVEVIRLERSLAAKVIHMASSPFYGSGTCHSIEEAVQRLGFRTVHGAIMTLMAVETYAQPLRVYRCTPAMLWKQSIATALAAKELAQLNFSDEAAAYTLGLLHNVGMVAIDRWVLARDRRITLTCANWPDEWLSSEMKLLGFDHSATTAAMLRAWGFPSSMVDAAQYQFRPDGARTGHHLAVILFCARWVRRLVCTPSEYDQFPDQEVLRAEGIQLNDLIVAVQNVSLELDRLWNVLQLAEEQAPTN